ncbi:SHD1 domain-containing protein [Luteolibacter algae]|uniref:SHD1 domain-containing protein n=1 Tax=Luteolibacter algae TaxID=454151 RepID=A0ABW5D6C1_9BACT
MSRNRLVIFFLLLACLFAQGAESERTFRSNTGQEIRATFLGLADETVTLLRADGKSFDVPMDKLSEEDQNYVREMDQRFIIEAKALNEAAGREIVTGEEFTKIKALSLAKALGLPAESNSVHGRSWRLYAAYAKDYKLFGAMPYSVALYSDSDRNLDNISIVYANKGDFGSTAGFAEEHFNNGDEPVPEASLQEAMDQDEKTITDALSSVLGEPVVQKYGEGDARRSVSRWDWNGYAFLLSKEDLEYVSLFIVSKEMADNGGKSTKISDAELKQSLLEGMEREENGDVLIYEIPMVDQGPKGYCVPATIERALRTMGMSADMYLLAMIGESKSNGGTSTELLLENLKSDVSRKGRRTKIEEHDSVKIRDIKHYIDQGIPILWQLCSTDKYNDIANLNTVNRTIVDDPVKKEATQAKLDKKISDISELPKPDDDYHLCMIIGYNELTREIAVSDSWGREYERRWVPVEVADWASLGQFFMILP